MPAIRNAIRRSRFVLPAHDRPAVLERGQVVGRTFDSVPGPLISNEEWPGKLTREQQREHATT